jgi:hypothetical protein
MFQLLKLSPEGKRASSTNGTSFILINLFLPPFEPLAARHPRLFEDLVKIMDQIESTREIAC